MQYVRNLWLGNVVDEVIGTDCCCVHCMTWEIHQAEVVVAMLQEGGRSLTGCDDSFAGVLLIRVRCRVFIEYDIVELETPDVIC